MNIATLLCLSMHSAKPNNITLFATTERAYTRWASVKTKICGHDGIQSQSSKHSSEDLKVTVLSFMEKKWYNTCKKDVPVDLQCIQKLVFCLVKAYNESKDKFKDSATDNFGQIFILQLESSDHTEFVFEGRNQALSIMSSGCAFQFNKDWLKKEYQSLANFVAAVKSDFLSPKKTRAHFTR